MRARLSTCLFVAATVAALGAAWFFLAPPQLGGKTEYAITFGVSMEPHFHRGDLVVLRTRGSYAVGDVVAYRSHDLHRNVLHRIIGIHDGFYTFKGDNNDFVDPEHPTAPDLVGSEWLHVPRVGGWLAQLREPRNAATAAGLVVLLLLLGGGAPAARRRRPRPVERPAPAPVPLPRPRPSPAPAPEPSRPAAGGRAASSLGFALAGLGAGALAAAALLALAAFTHPLQRSTVLPGLYVQHGRFSYSAPVRRGATYQAPRVQSGEPVYLQLVQRLPVAFRYRLQAAHAGPVSGSASLAVVLHDDEGWRHRIVLAPPQRFDGTRTTLRGTLDLTRLRRLIAAFERQTGVHNTVYRVSLRAHVAVRGTVAARPLAATFSPSLAMDLDAYRLAVTVPTSPDASANALVHAQSGAGTRVEPVALHALGRSVTVARARRLALLGAAAAGALLLLGGLLTLAGRRDQEVAAIRRRYEDWIVDVLPADRPAAQERRVASMEALARLAEQYDRLILHESRDDGDAFLVEDAGVVYSYHVRTWDRRLAVAR